MHMQFFEFVGKVKKVKFVLKFRFKIKIEKKASVLTLIDNIHLQIINFYLHSLVF